MKIIKKLCIPLLSLVLVLSCFTVSQMDASAAMSANDHIGPGSNQGGGDRLGPGPSWGGGDHIGPGSNQGGGDYIGPGPSWGGGDHIGPGPSWGGGAHFSPPGTRYPESSLNVSCEARIKTPEGYTRSCGCYLYQDVTVIYPDDGHPYGTSGYCKTCGHSYSEHSTGSDGGSGGGSYVPSHTHNYSTTWGAWRKISSRRLPG